MTKANEQTAREWIDQAAKANGWTAQEQGGEIEYRKPRRGYLAVSYDAAGRVRAVRGARRMNGTDPYPLQSTGMAAHAVAILDGTVR